MKKAVRKIAKSLRRKRPADPYPMPDLAATLHGIRKRQRKLPLWRVKDLALHASLIEALANVSIVRVDQLIRTERAELLKLPGMGLWRVAIIEGLLMGYWLHLDMYGENWSYDFFKRAFIEGHAKFVADGLSGPKPLPLRLTGARREMRQYYPHYLWCASSRYDEDLAARVTQKETV